MQVAAEETFSRRYAWYVVWLLTFAYGVAILDRVVISLLIEPIKQQFALSDFEIALLSSAAFGLCYSLMALPFGWLADRYDRRWIVTAGITVWSAAAAACGLARGFLGLFAGRLFVGVGEASLNPAATSMIADLFTGPARAKAYGLFVGGTAFGTGAAFMLGSAAITAAEALRADYADWFGGFANWQIVFILTSLPGLVVALLIALTVREPLRRSRGAASSARLLPFLVQHRVAVGTTIIGLCCAITALYTLITWYPALLIRVHGWKATEVGTVLGLFGPPFALLGAVCSGWLIGRFQRAGHRDAPLLVGILAAVTCGAALVGTGLAGDSNVSVVFYCIATLISNAFSASALAALAQLAPNELRGRLTAMLTLCIGLLSLNLGPLLVGLFSDHLFGPQRLDRAFALTVALACAAAAVILLAGRSAYRRSAQETEASGAG